MSTPHLWTRAIASGHRACACSCHPSAAVKTSAKSVHRTANKARNDASSPTNPRPFGRFCNVPVVVISSPQSLNSRYNFRVAYATEIGYGVENKNKACKATQVVPSPRARLRISQGHERPALVVLGRPAPEEIAQLLDHHNKADNRQARRLSSHHGRLGSVAGWALPVQHGQ